MKIDKPVLFFDFETTNPYPDSARIVSMALIKLEPSGKFDTFEAVVDPIVAIPVESSNIHGITNKDVSGKEQFSYYAKELFDSWFSCEYYCGYNLRRFDLPVAYYEFKRAGFNLPWREKKVIDPYIIFNKKEPRTLAGALKFFCDSEIDNAHNAMSDIMATRRVADAQFQKYFADRNVDAMVADSMDSSVVDLAGKIKKTDDGKYVFTFGKEKGKPIRECRDFAEWVLRSDFPEDTKEIIRSILK